MAVDNLGQIRTSVQYDLSVGAESTLFTPTVINDAINRTYRKIGHLHRWPKLEDAKQTTTQANINYYDYPSTWRPGSIWKLMVNGKDYGDPIEFKDWLYETENDIPSGEDYLWANQWMRYFVYPTPTSAGLVIKVWGQKVVTELTADANETIFTGALPEINDAIVKETVAILKHPKGQDAQSSTLLSAEALTIVEAAWGQVKQNTAKREKTTGGWNVTDLFNRKTRAEDRIGNF